MESSLQKQKIKMFLFRFKMSCLFYFFTFPPLSSPKEFDIVHKVVMSYIGMYITSHSRTGINSSAL